MDAQRDDCDGTESKSSNGGLGGLSFVACFGLGFNG